MLKRKITLKHIAKELGVSISTVSKALKNSPEIGKETKQKIQAFAKLYNYKPNNIALSLKNKRTKNIGVIIPDIVHYFFTTVVRGIEKYANSKGYNVIVCLSDESFDKEVNNMEMLANGSIDGFILSLAAGTQEKSDYAHLNGILEQGIPIVLFDRIAQEVECDKVIIDDALGAYTATKKLINEGRRRIALLTTHDFFSVSQKRKNGYQKALEDFGLPSGEDLTLRLPHNNFDSNVLAHFLKTKEPDAILSVNEIFAIDALRFLLSEGLQIPKDVSIIGFTDGLLSRYANPALTSVAQHGDRMGATAAKMLIQQIETEEETPNFQTVIIEPTLVERDSTIN